MGRLMLARITGVKLMSNLEIHIAKYTYDDCTYCLAYDTICKKAKCQFGKV